MKKIHSAIIISSLFIITSCGGGGGGGGSSNPLVAAISSFITSISSVEIGNDVTLTWNSSNSTSCQASGDWSGQKSTSGSETISIDKVGNSTFSLVCTGEGGSSGTSTVIVEGYRLFGGITVDGYISGADIFIDENDNYQNDSNEASTTSDNDGKFSIRYANGNLISLGGTDLDSQIILDDLLITHKLSGYSEFKAITPITSIAAFLDDGTDVNSILGISDSYDLFTFDPVANKGDGGMVDYIYEKGNQLTVLAFALQNVTNNLNTSNETTEDYFKAIAEELDLEYQETSNKVDIETEEFIAKVVSNIESGKSLTLSSDNKENTIKALSGVLPIIEVKSTNDLTTSVVRFAVSTFQDDIQAISNGTASSELVSKYKNSLLSYIGEDQNIDSDLIAPTVSAEDDSATIAEDNSITLNILANDSYQTASQISITTSSPTNGAVTVNSSSIIYTPNQDYFGSDSFTYTITQASKTATANVLITVTPVNDVPVINIASSISIDERSINIATVGISDADGDTLALTLAGTDSDLINLSSENKLSFKTKSDYETKNSYSFSLNLTDGTVSVSKDISISINDLGEIVGSAIDGYISGANVFIDQNFNFTLDDGEINSVTNTEGSFELLTSIDSFQCLKNRPIVANVPIGAGDSSLGEVTEAYQMILPSINDNGSEAVVITPFSSIFADAIIDAKNEQKLEKELSLIEGCSSVGNDIATKVTSNITNLVSTLSSFGIDYLDLTSDFIKTPNGVLTERTANNIAQFLPGISNIQSLIKDEMSQNLGFSVTPNITLGTDLLQTLFDTTRDEYIQQIPFNTYATFSTDVNSSGWYKQTTINADGAIINSSGIYFPHICLSEFGDCSYNNASMNLDVLANYSKNYRNSVGWYRGVNKSDPISVGLVTNGSIEVSSSDVRYYGESSGENFLSCGTEEIIQLTGPLVNGEGYAYQYQTNYNEGINTTSSNACNITSTNRRATVEIRKVGKDINGNDESISTSYSTNDINTSSLFSSKPADLFADFENVNPISILDEIALLGFNLSDISNIRAKLSAGEKAELRYSTRYSNGQYKNQYSLEIQSSENLDTGKWEQYNESGEVTSTTNYVGKLARNFYAQTILGSESSNIINSSYYSNQLPVFAATTFTPKENQLVVVESVASDPEGQVITYVLSGEDQSSFNLSADGKLTFVNTPDYETRIEYKITITATDSLGASVTEDIIINVADVGEFKGSTIDGYVSGATVFIDQNFNFTKDTGELSAVTDTNGAFDIETDDLTLYQCLKNRPIVADVPVGAVDSTRGEVTQAYQMILPSINDAGAETIVISPFTSLLTQAVVAGKSSASDLTDGLSVAQGCSSIGDTVANNISTELASLINSVQSSFGITKSEMLGNFITSPGAVINEAKAQKIADFYPYLKQITDNVNSDLTSTHGKTITSEVALREDAANTILSSDTFDDLPLDFSTRWQTTPTSNGWYTEETIRAYGAKINSSGSLVDYQCLGTVEECKSTDYGLSSIADASKKWLKIVRFRNDNGITGYEDRDIEFNIEDDRRSVIDLGTERRDCVKKEEIKMYDPKESDGSQTHFRYSTGHVNIEIDTHECDPLYSGPKDLFLTIVDNNITSDGGSEQVEGRYTNVDITKSTILQNVITDPYTNRDSIDLKAFLDEVKSLPTNPGDSESIRDLLDPTNGDRACVLYSKQNANRQTTFSSQYCVDQSYGGGYKDTYTSTTQQYDSDGNRTGYTDSGEVYDAAALTAIKNDFTSSETFSDNSFIIPSKLRILSTNFSADENQTSIGTISIQNPASATISYSVTGTDRSSVVINGNGVLSFVSNPDYETKSSYSITVTIAGGGQTISRNVTISINDVYEKIAGYSLPKNIKVIETEE